MPSSKSRQIEMPQGSVRVFNLGPLPEGALLAAIIVTLPGRTNAQGITVSTALNASRIQAPADLESGARIIDDGDTIVNGHPQWSLQSVALVLLTMTITPLIRVTAGPRFVSFVITETTDIANASLLLEVIYLTPPEVAVLMLTPVPTLGAPRRSFQAPGSALPK